MSGIHQRLILNNIPRPPSNGIHDETYWLCDTLGLSAGRDIEDLSIRIVLHLLEESSKKEGVTSEHLADRLDITVGRVNHHLRNLVRSGVVYRERRLVYLRGRTLRESVRELRRDAERIFDELEKVASEIDIMMDVPENFAEVPHTKALVLSMKPG